jgi:hypothetical protein
LVEINPETYMIPDDTMLDKSFGPKVEVIRMYDSGDKKGRDPWRGVVLCVYVYPKTEHLL